MQSFLHGFLLSIGLILPLGVQNLFVFQQGAMQPNFLRSLPVVFTAAACDTLLIVAAVQGVSLLLLKFGLLKLVLVGIGVIFLFYMGWLTWNAPVIQRNEKTAQSLSIRQQIVFAITVSLLNPHAVLDTIGVIGTSSVNYEGQERLLFTVACISVSWIWFFSLAAVGRILGSQSWFFQGMTMINKFSAAFMWSAAIYMAYTVI